MPDPTGDHLHPDFIGEPTSGEVPLEVQFTDQSTATPGTRPISSWEWDFGDGENSTKRNPAHTYRAPGTYTITLTVSDGISSKSITKSAYITVTVQPAEAPTADFTAEPTVGEAPLNVNFTDRSTAGTNPIASRHWDFGDGSSSAEKNPIHTYAKAGNYSVKLTVSDGSLSDTQSKPEFVRVSKAIDECKQERFKCVICYFVLWVMGLIFYLYEKKNKCVRFHGLQSAITFLLLTILGFIFYEIAVLRVLFYYLIIPVTIVLWLLLMFKAGQGLRYKLPVIGLIAEKQVYK